jgi:hypothetical protein
MGLIQLPYRLRLSRMFSYPTTRVTKCGLGLPLKIYQLLASDLQVWLDSISEPANFNSGIIKPACNGNSNNL